MAIEVSVGYVYARKALALPALRGREQIHELLVVGGLPSLIKYTPTENMPPGRQLPITISIYDPLTRYSYSITGFDTSLSGNNVARVIEIASSLLPPTVGDEVVP